jgi:hypothetical protein
LGHTPVFILSFVYVFVSIYENQIITKNNENQKLSNIKESKIKVTPKMDFSIGSLLKE